MIWMSTLVRFLINPTLSMYCHLVVIHILDLFVLLYWLWSWIVITILILFVWYWLWLFLWFVNSFGINKYYYYYYYYSEFDISTSEAGEIHPSGTGKGQRIGLGRIPSHFIFFSFLYMKFSYLQTLYIVYIIIYQITFKSQSCFINCIHSVHSRIPFIHSSSSILPFPWLFVQYCMCPILPLFAFELLCSCPIQVVPVLWLSSLGFLQVIRWWLVLFALCPYSTFL